MARLVHPMPAPVAARLARQSFTYEPVGATRDGDLPPGFHVLDEHYRLGAGDAAFERAAEALLTWRMHLGAGLRVTASDQRVAEGGLVRCRLGPLPVPCRVVWVREEPDARGFGYGTLPGHPESGEESFVVHRDGGEVTLHVLAYSRPGLWVSRLAGPLGRWGQRRMVARYANALH